MHRKEIIKNYTQKFVVIVVVKVIVVVTVHNI